MSADQLPLIDPAVYFADPSIPDGDGAGYVGADGIVYDSRRRPIGRDKTHPNHAPKPEGLTVLDSAIERLRKQAEVEAEALGNRPGATIRINPPDRKIVSLIECGDFTIALDNKDAAWVLEHAGWAKLQKTNLPPLPQE